LAAKTSGLQGESITSHPSVKEELKKGTTLVPVPPSNPLLSLTYYQDFSYQEESVVISGKLVTRYASF